MNSAGTFQQDLDLSSSSAVSKSIALGYRKDIDGLRAVAVLLVVFYHLWEAFIPGGYIGVDVFFVISGYLISLQIITQLETSTFSLKNFYVHRIRRVLPAFIVVLFFVNIVGYFVLIPEDLKQLSQSSLSAVLSASNIYFWKVLQSGYFGTDATLLPLLHTWSLGVEEQFYFLWPITLLLIFKGLMRVGPKGNSSILYVLAAISTTFTIASLILGYWLRLHPSFVFYWPVARAFELLAGASLAIYWTKLKAPSAVYALLLSLIGLLIIVYAASCLKPDDNQIESMLLPCIGTLLLLYSGQNNKPILNRMLSCKLLTFMGLISYSLYLWHWPIIAYLNYAGIPIDVTIGLMVFAVSIVVSFISWKYVEQPFRVKYKFGFKNSVCLFLVIPVILIASLAFACSKLSNIGFNKSPLKVSKTIADMSGPYADCFLDTKESPSLVQPSVAIQKCVIGDVTQKDHSVLVVGDSHAFSLSGMLNVLLNQAHLKGYLMVQAGTPFLVGDIANYYPNKPMTRNVLLAKLIKENHFSYVVLGGFWNNYSNSLIGQNIGSKIAGDNNYSLFEKGLDDAVGVIVRAGSIPILAYDVPPLLRVRTYCGLTKLPSSPCYNSDNKIEKIMDNTRQILLNLRHHYPCVRFIDSEQVICNDGKCVSSIHGLPLYHTSGDNSHLNYPGASVIGEIYSKKYKNPFV